MKEKRLLLRKTVIQQLRRLLEPALVIIRMHHDGDKLLAIAVGRDGQAAARRTRPARSSSVLTQCSTRPDGFT